MFVVDVSLAEDESVNDLTIDALDENKEGLHDSVNFLVPTEVRNDGEVNSQKRAGDGCTCA